MAARIAVVHQSLRNSNRDRRLTALLQVVLTAIVAIDVLHGGQFFITKGSGNMRAATLIQTALSVMAMSFALASAAQATAARTWVSSAGLDGNTSTNCQRTAPCKTFVGAYSVTQAGGEIVALDVAGYGPLTITGPVSIVGLEGGIVTVTTGTVGFTITAGPTDVVVLRNLQISATAGSSNTTGIQVNSGRLVLQNSTLKQLTTALIVTSTHADVVNTDFDGNSLAVQTNGVGGGYNGFVFACPCATLVRINAGNMIDNTTVFNENNPTVVMSQSTATIYIFQSGTEFSANITGYTTMMTITGTGGSNVGPQTYSGTGAPN